MNLKVYPYVVPNLALCAGLVFAAVSVTIEEWSIPSADRLSHDPAVAPDGALGSNGFYRRLTCRTRAGS